MDWDGLDFETTMPTSQWWFSSNKSTLPKCPQTAPPTGDKTFKYKSPWGDILIKTTTSLLQKICIDFTRAESNLNLPCWWLWRSSVAQKGIRQGVSRTWNAEEKLQQRRSNNTHCYSSSKKERATWFDLGHVCSRCGECEHEHGTWKSKPSLVSRVF